MGGWVSGQAEYVMVPYADFNLLKFPDKERALSKIRDLTLLSDIFPTGAEKASPLASTHPLRPPTVAHSHGRVTMCPGFHGAYTAGVRPGSTVYVAGAGPVGLACAASCHLLGAAVVIVGDMIPDRLAQAKSFGCEVVDISKGPVAEQIQQILGTPQVPTLPLSPHHSPLACARLKSGGGALTAKAVSIRVPAS